MNGRWDIEREDPVVEQGKTLFWVIILFVAAILGAGFILMESGN